MAKTTIKPSRVFLTEFFNLYHQHPCLWDKENPHYNNKAYRDLALDVLTRKMKEVNQNAGRYETLRKINMYRSNFKRELIKRERHESAGSSPNYKSTLWYYECLQFLVKAVSEPRKRNASIKNVLQVKEVDNQNVPKNHKLKRPINSKILRSLLSEKRMAQNENNPAQPEELDHLLQLEQQQLNQLCKVDAAGHCYDEVEIQIEESQLDQKRDELVATVMENIGRKLKSVPLHKLPLVEKLIGDLLNKTRDHEVGQCTRVNLSEEIPSFEQTFLSGWSAAPFNVDLKPQHPKVIVAPVNVGLKPQHPAMTAEVTLDDNSKRCCVDKGSKTQILQ